MATCSLTPSPAGIAFIKKSEGLSLSAYPDPGSGGQPWTIGYGHTGLDVHAGQIISSEEADNLLQSDLQYFTKGVCKLVRVKIAQNPFDALLSFAFNLGLENLNSSTLLKKLNMGDFPGAAAEFLRWNRASGHVLPGLTTRRLAEKKMFLEG